MSLFGGLADGPTADERRIYEQVGRRYLSESASGGVMP